MYMVRKMLLLASVPLLFLCSCKSATEIPSEYAAYGFEIECLRVGGDGCQTLRSWGRGANMPEAVEQAKRNAVETVLFKGVSAGAGDFDKRPIVTEVNAQEKYEDYFNSFFSSGGKYSRFVTVVDGNGSSVIKASGKSVENYGVVVTVDRVALRQCLIDDGIILNN